MGCLLLPAGLQGTILGVSDLNVALLPVPDPVREEGEGPGVGDAAEDDHAGILAQRDTDLALFLTYFSHNFSHFSFSSSFFARDVASPADETELLSNFRLVLDSNESK